MIPYDYVFELVLYILIAFECFAGYSSLPAVLLYIMFGGLRFVSSPQLDLASPETGNHSCEMIFDISVEQSSSDGTFITDPSRSLRTAIFLLFTGDASVGSQLSSVAWENDASYVDLSSVASSDRSAHANSFGSTSL